MRTQGKKKKKKMGLFDLISGYFMPEPGHSCQCNDGNLLDNTCFTAQLRRLWLGSSLAVSDLPKDLEEAVNLNGHSNYRLNHTKVGGSKTLGSLESAPRLFTNAAIYRETVCRHSWKKQIL